MNQDDYFITGYTGYCPNMTDHIGYNYHKATRSTMKSHPHLKTRLSDVHRSQEMPMESLCNQDNCNYWCSAPPQCAPPQCAPGYQMSAPQNMWYPCQGDGHARDAAAYPEQAYPLNCSEWGSPCVSNHCNAMYSPCLERKPYTCGNYLMMPNEAAYTQTIQQRYQPDPEPCCSSCARGGPCKGDSGSQTPYFKYAGYDCKLAQERFDPHRKGGVIPNYMGHIPGMQGSFGESFGIAASRLLRRHFDELSRKGL